MKPTRKLVAIFSLCMTVLVLASPLNVLLDAAISSGEGFATALIYPIDHFITAPLEPRIRYEPGAGALAMLAEPELKGAIAHIESRQAQPFPGPITVYVTATRQSFQKLTPATGDPRAVVFNQAIFLSPKLAERPETVAATLTHELSHLHISQLLGSWRLAALPTWFTEGVATYLSGGMGAENVSEVQAIAAIKAGKRFTPTSDENSLFPKSADSYDLTAHMFYRQSALFIAYLDEQQPNAIGSCIAQLKAGKNFSEAFEAAFGETVEAKWTQFLKAVDSSEGQ